MKQRGKWTKTMKAYQLPFLLLCLLIMSDKANANLLITPTRVHFDARERTEEIIVVNTSDEVRSYSLSWDEKKQNKRSFYEKLSAEDMDVYPKASDYVRFSPRRITLSPGENQKIKMMVRRTSSMPKDDFHSHLKFTLIPTSVTKPAQSEEVDGVQIKLNFFLNYSIPILVTNHERPAKISLTQLSFTPPEKEGSFGSISLTTVNDNDTFAYGNFTVLFKGKNTNQFEPVGYDNAVNIFTYEPKVIRKIPLIKPLSDNKGVFKVVFEGAQELKSKLQATGTLVLE
jgi:P pilus assembly chaperone PapD